MLLRRLLILASLSLVACGGGGGGGSASSSSSGSNPSTTSTTTLGASNPGRLSPTTTVSGNTLIVQSSCPFTLHMGAARGDGLNISNVAWLQTASFNADSSTARLAGGKAVTVRVDLLANAGTTAPTTANMLIYNPTTKACTTVSLKYQGSGSSVPTTADASSLSTAWTGTIPATLVQTNMQVSLYTDDNTGRSQSELANTYRVYAPPVTASNTQTVWIIPINYNGKTGAIASTSQLANLLVRMHPLSAVSVQTDTALAPKSLCGLLGTGCLLGGLLNSSTTTDTLTDMNNLLADVDDRCQSLAGTQSSAATSPKCIGVFPDNIQFTVTSGSTTGYVVGLSYVGGITAVTQQAANASDIDDTSVTSPYLSSEWIGQRGITIAHEFGHLLNLRHANCGNPSNLDSRLYADGRIGSGAGYDAYRGFYFSNVTLSTPQFADLMSYCSKEWPSDLSYLYAMSYLYGNNSSTAANVVSSDVTATDADPATVPSAGSRPASASQWVRVMQQSDGSWAIRHVHMAPGSLKSSGLDVGVISDSGAEQLPMYSAVAADQPSLSGPYYVNLGARQLQSLTLLQSGAIQKQWNASDIPPAP